MHSPQITPANSKFLVNVLVFFGDIGMVFGTMLAVGINHFVLNLNSIHEQDTPDTPEVDPQQE